MTAGIYLRKKTGDSVEQGQVLATVYGTDPARVEEGAKQLLEAYEIGDRAPQQQDLIKKVIR